MIEVTFRDTEGGRWITVQGNTIDEAMTNLNAAIEHIKEAVHDRET